MLNLMTIPAPAGNVLGAWRHPDSWSDNLVMDLDHFISIAKTAERGKFAGIFLPDGNGVRQMDRPELFRAVSPADRPAIFEPVTLLSAISQHTSHVGLAATATTTYEEPFHLARKFASLDHLSGGRAAWNIVTTSDPDDSKNFGFDDHLARDRRYPRAMEFIEVVKGLWDSWAEDAFVQNRETGDFLDPSRVHVLNHEGEYFKVSGPLNVARPIQGYPVLFTAGQSEAGRELAAKQADCLFTVAMTKKDAVALFNDVKGRLAKYGRTPEMLKIFPCVSAYVAPTAEEAEALYTQITELILPNVGVQFLSKTLMMDLSGCDIDGPVPEIDMQEVVGLDSVRKLAAAFIKANNLTVRQAYQTLMPLNGGPMFKGNPIQVADMIEDWYVSGACDGLMVTTPVSPKVLENFVELVVPELQRRGIMRTEYAGSTLRENLGLSLPPSRFF
jgi:N-acetyl-S-(2-succino)cysteine monooxygenase